MKKTVIIEDEVIAAQTLRNLLTELEPDMEVLATLQSVEESVDWFHQHDEPDMVFMDIHLADGSSFHIFDSVTLKCPIIFTTAY
ncbi:MAG: response regulator, partial [Bacteroidales bacterium]|nr:response regulator [Bacteroidales bacterium]